MFTRIQRIRYLHNAAANIAPIKSSVSTDPASKHPIQLKPESKPSLLQNEIKHLIYTKKFPRLLNRLNDTTDIRLINHTLGQLISKDLNVALNLLQRIDERKLIVDQRTVAHEVELIKQLLSTSSDDNVAINNDHSSMLSKASARAWAHAQTLHTIQTGWCGVFAQAFEQLDDVERMSQLLNNMASSSEPPLNSAFVKKMYERMLNMFTRTNRKHEIDLMQSCFPFQTTREELRPVPSVKSSFKRKAINQSVPNASVHELATMRLVDQAKLDEAIQYLLSNPTEMTTRCWRNVMLPLMRENRQGDVVSLWKHWLNVLTRPDVAYLSPEHKLLMTPTTAIYKLLLQCRSPPLNVATAVAHIDHWGQKWDNRLHNFLILSCIEQNDVPGAASWLDDMAIRGISGDGETLDCEIGLLKLLAADRSVADVAHRFAGRAWDRCEMLQHDIPISWFAVFSKVFRHAGDTSRQKQLDAAWEAQAHKRHVSNVASQ